MAELQTLRYFKIADVVTLGVSTQPLGQASFTSKSHTQKCFSFTPTTKARLPLYRFSRTPPPPPKCSAALRADRVYRISPKSDDKCGKQGHKSSYAPQYDSTAPTSTKTAASCFSGHMLYQTLSGAIKSVQNGAICNVRLRKAWLSLHRFIKIKFLNGTKGRRSAGPNGWELV